MKDPTTDPASGAGAVQGEHDFTALPVGARIGRYQITAILGQGGFGITYRARDEQLGREVAIKEYLPSALAVRHDGSTVLPRSTKVAEDFGWGRERFVSEGRTLASLHDAPAIVRVFDFMELNGTAYIVMELVRGDTLEGLLKQKGRLGPGEIDAILWPLLDGLEQVHATGFLHRDIKPANILMRPDGKPTLIDFGASRAAMAGRTTAMTAIFTPGYAAAEQFTSAKQGPWTDIYGLSATLYHAIAGTPPPSAFDRMLDDEYQPLTKLMPAGFEPALLLGLDAGLAVRAAERPQSIAGWRPLLAGAAATAAAGGDATVALAKQPDPNVTVAVTRAQPPSPTAAPPPPAPPAKSRIGLYAAAAAVVLLLLAGGWFLMGDKSSSPKAVALQDMKVEELEKVLEERRRAEAEAAEKRRAEEEAKQKAEADAASKRAADDELAKAEEQRKKAEEELARLREELEAQKKAAAEQRELADAQAKRAAAQEARRKVEAEMAALRAAEEEARRKAAVEAEAKKLADEALARAQAEREKAEADAKSKAAAEEKSKKESDERTRKEAEARAKEHEKKEKAEAEAKEKAEKEAKAKLEADRKSAEAAETALKLTTVDRQRLQVALTALGHNTGGSDGAFGPRTRQAIASWQKSRQEPETGFLTAAQQQALLEDAAPAVAKFDDEQKKLDSFDGSYGGTLAAGGGIRPATVQVSNGTGSGTFGHPRCGQHPFTFRISASGEIAGTGQRSTPDCTKVPATVSGRAANRQLQLVIAGSGINLTGTLMLGASAPPMPKPPAAAAPQASAPQATAVAPPPPAAGGANPYDGRWTGMAALAGGANLPVWTTLQNGTGKGTWHNRRCGADVAFTVTIQPDGRYVVVLEGYDGQCRPGTNRFSGTVQGNTLRFIFAGQSTFTLSR